MAVKKGLVTLSEIRWCDTGGHPFSLNDPDRKFYAGGGDGRQDREYIDICGPCVKKGAFRLASFPDYSGESVEAPAVESGKHVKHAPACLAADGDYPCNC